MLAGGCKQMAKYIIWLGLLIWEFWSDSCSALLWDFKWMNIRNQVTLLIKESKKCVTFPHNLVLISSPCLFVGVLFRASPPATHIPPPLPQQRMSLAPNHWVLLMLSLTSLAHCLSVSVHVCVYVSDCTLSPPPAANYGSNWKSGILHFWPVTLRKVWARAHFWAHVEVCYWNGPLFPSACVASTLDHCFPTGQHNANPRRVVTLCSLEELD